jgi:serine/threonine-protein kinase ATR
MIARSKEYSFESLFQSLNKSGSSSIYRDIQWNFSSICQSNNNQTNFINELQKIIQDNSLSNIFALFPLTSTMKALPSQTQPMSIASISAKAPKIQSLLKPTIIRLKNNHGNKYKYLLKHDEDARKDMHVMNFASIINQLFSKFRSSRQRNLFLTTYLIIYLDQQKAMIEWVENTIELYSAIDEIKQKQKPIQTNSRYFKFFDRQKKLSSDENFELFVQEVLSQNPSVLHIYYANKFNEPSKWHQTKTLFSRSVACWSIVGYILGLGDRYTNNILLNEKTGACLHVDFAVLFNKGEYQDVPETVPFSHDSQYCESYGNNWT